ncbi:MAG: glycosyltransferase family 9 protein [Acidobacteria bacterium]|nr:glycosyltransferase family 9 protein [Acidobacteriota bacterium]
MASTSAEVLARGGEVDDAVIDALVDAPASELFGELIEPLSDAFEPRFVDVYVSVFSRVLERLGVGSASALAARFGHLSAVATFEPRRVVVLSRVTLGADIAITSTLLRAAAMRWPSAEIVFAGPRKNHELFASDERIGLLEAPFQRMGSLRERVGAGMALRVDRDDTLVIDPDSRISQLGLLPLADASRVLFFPSRSVGGPDDSLVALARAFALSALGVSASPWIAPPTPEWVPSADVAVSFGVGENAAKRIDDEYEIDVVQGLLDRRLKVLLDSGAPGTAEAERAARIEASCRGPLLIWQGSFAPFAAAIGRSRMYVGYDSAGQHVAAACGVPRVTVMAGHPNARFAARWRPDGEGASEIVFEAERVWEAVERVHSGAG